MDTKAIILARGGSERIPGKNIINFCGKPLLLWTIEQLKETEGVGEIWVSSDDNSILELSKESGCRVVLRPGSLSNSRASSESAWLHAIDIIERKCREKIDIVISPQVTSPIREKDDMTKALCEFKNKNYHSMFSCSPTGIANGSFWIFKSDYFKSCCLPHFNYIEAKKFYMESWKSFQIDYPIDLKNCELLMNHFILGDEYYEMRDSKIKDDYYEKDCWHGIDPDGTKRNLEDEHQRKLEDCKEELDYINRLSPGNILDVGCGLGFVLFGIDPRWNKYGVDISKWAVEHASKYGTIFQGTLQQANYKSNVFDVIILYQSLEHIPNPIEVLIEARRILKPNGRLIINTPDFKCGLSDRFGDNFRFLNDKSHISLFDSLGLFRLLTDLEFRVEKISRPYFNTVHFTKDNLLRLFNTSKTSPPFYGNLMSVYSYKKENK